PRLIEFLMKRTEPSPNVKLAPPGCRLLVPPTNVGVPGVASGFSSSAVVAVDPLDAATNDATGLDELTNQPALRRLARVPDAQPWSRPSLSFSLAKTVWEEPSVMSS